MNDPLFHIVVDSLYAHLLKGKITVDELRGAATFAGYKFETLHLRPIFINKEY